MIDVRLSSRSAPHWYACVRALFAWLAFVSAAYPGLEVDVHDREDSRQFFNQYFLETSSTQIDWSGDHTSCDPGSTSDMYRDAVETQINYFRAMAGVPAAVELSDEFNAKAQEAALLMSKNIRIDHFPPSGWSCYTEDAAEAASNSNLLLGTHGPSAVARYMLDPGGENYFVGHRRWLLHPQTQEMGTGDVPRRGFMPAANAIWVFDGRTFDPRPDTRDEYIAWPPAGFVPNSVVYPRWSFSLPNADFRQASVTVSLDGTEVPVNIEPVRDGFGDPTLVWHFNEHIGGNRDLENDLTARVSIDGIRQGGNSRRYEYDVTIFDPATPSFGSSLTPTPPIIDVAPAPPTCAGSDLNGDGRISFTDFLLLSENFGTENVAGDVDCDGQVNFDDFLLFTRDFRRLGEADSLTRVTNTVPEPSPTSLANLCVVLVSLLVGRHRMQRPTCSLAEMREHQ